MKLILALNEAYVRQSIKGVALKGQTSHGFVHVLDFDQPVEVIGLNLKPGDLIHADRHGAVVIPQNVIPDFHTAIEKLLATEKLVLEPARAPGFDFETFEKAWAAFEAART